MSDGPRDPKDAAAGDSLGIGVLTGCATLVVSVLLAAGWISIVKSMYANVPGSPTATKLMLLAALLPIALNFAGIFYFAHRGRPRASLGMFAALALGVIAVPLLLIAKCFGM